jgi:hypothetical protein
MRRSSGLAAGRLEVTAVDARSTTPAGMVSATGRVEVATTASDASIEPAQIQRVGQRRARAAPSSAEAESAISAPVTRA